MDNSVDSEVPLGQDPTLMMPQILSGPRNVNSEMRQQAAERVLAAKQGQMQARQRRRSRGDRSRAGMKSRQSMGKHVACMKIAMPAEGPLPARPTLQEIGSPAQARCQQVAQHFLENPALTVPEAQPTPQKPQALPSPSDHLTDNSPSFSPDKAHQFSQLDTPQNKVKKADRASSNWQPGQTSNVHTPVGKSGSR